MCPNRIRRSLILLSSILVGSLTPAPAADRPVPLAPILLETALQEGSARAIEQYHELKRMPRGTYDTGEAQLYLVGHRLLDEKRYGDAIAIFRLNVTLFPASVKARDSLAEALMRSGDRTAAANEYRRSLSLLDRDPQLSAIGKRNLRRDITSQLMRLRIHPLYEEVVGLYHASDGRFFSITLAERDPRRLPPALRFVEFPSGRVRTLFHRSRYSFIAGSGQMVAWPVEFRLRFDMKSSGGPALVLDESSVSMRAVRVGERTERVTFRNGSLELRGILTLPVGDGPHPVAVLLHGSGVVTRDMPGFGELAHSFLRSGFAVLRYDKRGAGDSTIGLDGRAGLVDLANDALSAARFLRDHPAIDAERIGFLGFSEGAWVALLAASHMRDPAFLILVSGGGVAPWIQESYRVPAELEADGFSSSEIIRAAEFMRVKFDVARSIVSWDEYERARSEARGTRWFPRYTGLWRSEEFARRAWLNTLGFEPALILDRLDCPILGLFGDNDRLTPVPETVDSLRRGLEEAGHPDFSLIVFPRANHCLLESESGSLRGGEFPRLKRYVPGVFDTLERWIVNRVRSDEEAAAEASSNNGSARE
ncbi:MAG TPA: alpha/beta fold hydrolase [Thermoanaerobaculia bacterium]|nr:alpha/beta fold hydrolase [Thermoanaerobaculia bacterium]